MSSAPPPREPRADPASLDPARGEADLEEALSRPSPRLVELMGRLDGDLSVLGVAGKMGVSLATAAARAAREAGVTKRVVGVARFTDASARRRLESAGVETMACDLLDRAAVARLPRTPNVVFMAGRKFGTSGDEELTWALNVLVPAHVAEHYPASRIVAFSTGCVYPLVAPATGGCRESELPAPVGEYAQSCLGRERIFEHFSRRAGTPVCLFRLNYAIDLRYGVLHDIGLAILEDRPVDLAAGWFNCIWQGEANERALLALEHCRAPALRLNVTGPEIISVREVAAALGRELGREPRFRGEEGETAYLADASRSIELFGPPAVSLDEMVRWTAAWLAGGGRSLGKPTHFEVRDGRY